MPASRGARPPVDTRTLSVDLNALKKNKFQGPRAAARAAAVAAAAQKEQQEAASAVVHDGFFCDGCTDPNAEPESLRPIVGVRLSTHLDGL